MSRSGYTDDCANLNLWRGAVNSAIKGKRGQRFLKELAAALDKMPLKRLIQSELITENGEVCAIGSVCKERQIDVSKVDVCDPEEVGSLVNISHALAAEIEYLNDEGVYYEETPEQRWVRMRKWVAENLNETHE